MYEVDEVDDFVVKSPQFDNLKVKKEQVKEKSKVEPKEKVKSVVKKEQIAPKEKVKSVVKKEKGPVRRPCPMKIKRGQRKGQCCGYEVYKYNKCPRHWQIWHKKNPFLKYPGEYSM
jgi:hypothetical protein